VKDFLIRLHRILLLSFPFVMMAFTLNQVQSQTTVFVTGSEFHWSRGAVSPVIQKTVIKQLTGNNYRIAADSNTADFILSIKCHSYYNGETPFFFFGLLDATLGVYDVKNARIVYANELKRIKGGSTTVELADDKVYANASRIIADTLTRFINILTKGQHSVVSKQSPEVESRCDADKDIPELPQNRQNTYVLIVANDAYSPMQTARCFTDSIDYHSRDARVFREYAIRTLGIPERNVQIVFNAKSFEMRRELIRLASYSRGINGNAELIFYYAGYGLIDEKTLEPYILPVDVENDDSKFIIRISDLYKMLQEDVSKRITILLESSFRFDALKHQHEKSPMPKISLRFSNVPANVFFLAAAMPGQKAWSDPKAAHGLFTLALLTKLKETKGKAGPKELSDFIIQNVRATSLKMKLKEQIPVSLIGSAVNLVVTLPE